VRHSQSEQCRNSAGTRMFDEVNHEACREVFLRCAVLASCLTDYHFGGCGDTGSLVASRVRVSCLVSSNSSAQQQGVLILSHVTLTS